MLQPVGYSKYLVFASRRVTDVAHQLRYSALCNKYEFNRVVLRIARDQSCEFARDKMAMNYLKHGSHGASICLKRCACGDESRVDALMSSSRSHKGGCDSTVSGDKLAAAARGWRHERQ